MGLLDLNKEKRCDNCKWHMDSKQGKNNKLCTYNAPPKYVQEWMRCRHHEFED
jgi:hypothetical protein